MDLPFPMKNRLVCIAAREPTAHQITTSVPSTARNLRIKRSRGSDLLPLDGYGFCPAWIGKGRENAILKQERRPLPGRAPLLMQENAGQRRRSVPKLTLTGAKSRLARRFAEWTNRVGLLLLLPDCGGSLMAKDIIILKELG